MNPAPTQNIDPCTKIADWIEQSAGTYSKDINFLIGMMLSKDEKILPGGDDDFIREYLRDDRISYYRKVGRALSFKACFEHMFGDRWLSDEKWNRNKALFESVIAAGKADPDSKEAQMSDSAQKFLDGIPQHMAEWKRIGASWQQFAEEHLSHEALEDFASRSMTPL